MDQARNRTPLEHRLAAEQYLDMAFNPDICTNEERTKIMLMAAITESLLAWGGSR